MKLKKFAPLGLVLAGLLICSTAHGQDSPPVAPSEPVAALIDAGTPADEAPAETAPAASEEAPEKAPAPEAGADSAEAADPAAEEAPKLPDVGSLGEIKDAVTDGNYPLAALLILVFLVAILRWGASKLDFLSFFNGKLGGYILVFTSSAAGMLLTTLGAGGSITFKGVSEALLFGFGAIGGWEAWKDWRKSRKPAEEPATAEG